MSRVPELRFPGFTEEWREIRIGDVLSFIKNYSFSRADLSDNGDIYYVHYGDIHKKFESKIDFSVATLPKISLKKFKHPPEYLKDGDLIMADASEDYADVGKSAEVVNLNDKLAVGGLHTFVLRDKTKFSPGFKGYMFFSPNISKELKRIATGISVLGISKKNLQNLKLFIPTLPEQQKIADFLSAVDEKIETVETKINQLERYKKGVMQQLLSGEVRFPGFTEEWREVKLGDICEPPKYGLNAPATKFRSDLPAYLRITDITEDGRYIKENKVSVDIEDFDEYILKEGDLVFARTGATVGKTYLYKKEDGLLVYAGYLIKFSPKPNLADARFIKFFTETPKYWKWVSVVSVRSGQPGINSQEYSSMQLFIPSLSEQQKIADFLTAVDDKITTEKERLERLKTYKKGLLQKMFV